MSDFIANTTTPMLVLYAAGLVLGLFILFYLLSKLFGRSAMGRRGSRLGVVEYCEIDKSRRLVILRRDEVEHLVLIGGTQDLVLETAIGIGEPRSKVDFEDDQELPALPSGFSQQAAKLKPRTVVPMRAPRAPVFGNPKPIIRAVDNPAGPLEEEPKA